MQKRIASLIVLWLMVIPMSTLAFHRTITPPTTDRQTVTTYPITISFDEAAVDDSCLNAVNAYAGLYVSGSSTTDVSLPVVVTTDGVSNACQFNPDNEMRVRTGRPAEGLMLTFEGAFKLELLLNGQLVEEASPQGLTEGGIVPTFTSTAQFDEVVLRKESGSSAFTIFDISLNFAVERRGDYFQTFEGAEGQSCLDILNAGGLYALGGDSASTPALSMTADAGRDAPECNLTPNQNLVVALDRPAYFIEFAASRGVNIVLLLDGEPVQPAEFISGPFSYSAVSLAGFNEVHFFPGELGVRIDDLGFEFARDGFPLNMGFEGLSPDDFCTDALSVLPGITALADSTTESEPPRIVVNDDRRGLSCQFEPGNRLTLHLERRAVRFGFWVFGGANVELRRDGELIREPDQLDSGRHYYLATDAEGFDEITLTENSGASGIRIDSLRLAIVPAQGEAVSIDFFAADLGRACVDVIVDAGLAATATESPNFGPPTITETDAETAFSFDVRCNVDPGGGLIIQFPAPAMVVNFQMVGGATVELRRAGETVLSREVSGLPTFFNEIVFGGFDALIITEPSGFSSFGIMAMQFTYAD